MDPQQFFRTLWGDPPPGVINIWRLPDRTSSWHRDLGSINSFLQQFAHEEVYTGVSLVDPHKGRFTTKNRIEEVAAGAIAGVWSDIDVFHQVHSKAERLPANREEAQEVMDQLPYEPTLIVDSGHGLQYWWLLEKPWVFENEAEWGEARRVTQWWHRQTKALFEARGWTTDSVFDLSRILRIPGTFNNKVKEDPKPVTAIKTGGPRYSVEDFSKLVPEDFVATLPAPEQKRGRRGRASSYDGAFTTASGFILDPEAEPKPVRLQALLKADVRFRLTWERKRPDLPDQSASGFDMSVASFTVAADWPDQEVVNAMICRRRMHGEDLKLRERYYELTLARAKVGVSKGDTSTGADPKGEDNAEKTAGPKAGANTANGADATADPSAEDIPPDLANLLRTVRSRIHESTDPEVLHLIHEIHLLAGASSEATDPGKKAAANLQARYEVYVSLQDPATLDALTTAVKMAMSPATQVPLLVRRTVKALLEDEKSFEQLAELKGMLQRQAAADRNEAHLINLEAAAALPVPRSLFRAKGMSGSILDVGEVSVFSGMGGAGKSTLTLVWGMDLAFLGRGTKGLVGGVFRSEGGPVLMVSYEERAAVMGLKARRWADHLDQGDPNGPYHAARQQVAHLGIRNPIFGADPYTRLYGARPTLLEGWDEVVQAAKKIQPIMIVIDPALCAFVSDSTDAAAVSEFLMCMRDLAVMFDCGVIVVTHSTKAARGSSRRRGQDAADPGQFLGTGAWTDRCRSAMTITTDPDGHLQLAVAKANMGPQKIGIALTPVLGERKQLLGYKADETAGWKPLAEENERDSGNRNGAQSRNSTNSSQGKGLFED